MMLKTLSPLLFAALALAHPGHEKRQLPTGSIISACYQPGAVALTFDDGPFAYTNQLLDILGAAGMKATFFLNGANFGSIYNYQGVVQRMVNEGHQVGSHTWGHADLTTLDAGGITSQMQQLDTALLSIIGKSPKYMRPPYFATNGAVLSTLGNLGYHVINANIDTLDYQGNYDAAINNFNNGLNNGGSITLAHDVHAGTVQILAQRMIDSLRARGKTSVTVGSCLNDPAGNWYRTSGGGTTPPPPSGGGTPTPDGRCGNNGGFTCGGSECCSQYGWCGTGPDYCSSSCQTGFGTCPGGSTTPPPSNPPPSNPPPPPPSNGNSPDGRCGPGNGFTCGSSMCCSQYGWCGTSGDHCNAGCQGGTFGRCN